MRGQNYSVYIIGENIKISEGAPALSFIGGIQKEIYRINNSIIQINRINNISEGNYTSKSKGIILVNECNEENKEQIKKLIAKNNFIVLMGENKTSEEIQGGAYLSLIKNNEEINLNYLILAIETEELQNIVRFNGSSMYLVWETERVEKVVGGITEGILKNINFFGDCEEYIVKLFAKEEVGLRDIYHIQDGVRDYVHYESKLKVEQIITDEFKGKSFYLILGKKKQSKKTALF